MNTEYINDLIKKLEKQEELFIEELELNKKKEDVRQDILELCKKIQWQFLKNGSTEQSV